VVNQNEEQIMHGFIGEEPPHYQIVVHEGKEYRVPTHNMPYFHEAIKDGKPVKQAIEYAQNPFRVTC
jgi:hypothetical protein